LAAPPPGGPGGGSGLTVSLQDWWFLAGSGELNLFVILILALSAARLFVVRRSRVDRAVVRDGPGTSFPAWGSIPGRGGVFGGGQGPRFPGFGAMDVTKPYEFIGFGAMDVTKPCEFIGFGGGRLRPGEGFSEGPRDLVSGLGGRFRPGQGFRRGSGGGPRVLQLGT
jgi:hypothetical protein